MILSVFLIGPIMFFVILAAGGAVGWGVGYLITNVIFPEAKSPKGVDYLRRQKTYYEKRIDKLKLI